MLPPRPSIERWVRRGRDPIATTLRRAATSALGTYGAYVGYGLLHAGLREPLRGPEASEPLPGDELVVAPDSTKTFAIDIGAPAQAVWPYLVQMGYGRAGWYGWYPLENGGRGSADRVLDEWQDLAVGDAIPDGPHADQGLGVWRVVELEPARALVLFSRRVALTGRELELGEPVGEPSIECSWAFVLHPTDAGCRLIVRVRVHFLAMDGGLVGQLTRRFFDVGDTVMEWTMLAGIKARAEGVSRAGSARRSRSPRAPAAGRSAD
jgi:proline iminopeptidase